MQGNLNVKKWIGGLQLAAAATVGAVILSAGIAQAQVPAAVEPELVKMGHVVEPGCTAKLYRGLFGKNDYNTYWPVEAAMPNKTVKLYPGVTVIRDSKYGPDGKDLIDVFMPDKSGMNRTVLIFVPGGGGNKIEQQSVEANMFYDNIGTWAAQNGMVGVTIQRSPATPVGQNIAMAIAWLQENVAKYKGNPNDMFLMAHSAGTQSLSQYIGRPDLYGLGVKGAIFLGGSPNLNAGGGRGGGGRGAAAGAPGAPGGAAPGAAAGGAAPGAAAGAGRGAAGGGGGRGGGILGGGGTGAVGTSTCTDLGGANVSAGVIRGPASAAPDEGAMAAQLRMERAGNSPWKWDGKMWVSTGAAAPAPAAAGAGGGRGGGGGAGAAAGGGAAGGGRGGGAGRGAAAAPAADGTAPAAPAFTQLDGFRSTRAAIAIGYGQYDIGSAAGTTEVEQGPTAAVKAIHDELCKLDGPKPTDGKGHCPEMMWFKGESHMSEVFSFGSIDKTVSDPVLAFINRNK